MTDLATAQQTTTPSPDAHARAPFRARLLQEIAWAIGTGAVALLLTAIWLQLWRAKLHIPLHVNGDANFSLMSVKTLISNGWPGVDQHLGAPFGSTMYDDSVIYGDSLHLLIMKVLSLGSSDPVAVMNVFYVLTYPLIAISGYVALRALGFERPAASVVGVLYALLPFHFLRSQAHLYLGAYFSVPLGGLLVLRALRGTPQWARRPHARPALRWVSWTSAATLVMCLIVGTAEAYYAVFTLVLLVPLALLGALVARDWHRLIAPAFVAGAICAAALAVQAPPIIWHHEHGANTVVGHRQIYESELFALKLTNLVVPQPGHPVGFIDSLAHRYYDHQPEAPGESTNAALGSWFTLGLVIAVLMAAAGALGTRLTGRRLLVAQAGVAGSLAFLYGTIGGAGALFGFYGSSQLRGWNRISTFVAFFAAVGLAALLSFAFHRGRSRRGALLAGAFALLVLVTGLFDQARPGYRPAYAATAQEWRNDGRFVAGVEQQLPGQAMVLQLPYVPFPENPPVNKMTDYDELKGYLHSTRLRWTYGAMRGRYPNDWGGVLNQLPPRQFVPLAAAAGFQGVVIDTYGYADGGNGIVRQLERATGETAPTLVSADGRLVFFSLRGLAARAATLTPTIRKRAASTLLRPVDVEFGPGFYPTEGSGANTWHWSRSASTVEFDNDLGARRRVIVQFGLVSLATSPQRVTLRLPTGASKTVIVPPRAKERPVRLPLTLPSGKSELHLATTAPRVTSDPRDLHVQVANLAVVDEDVSRVAAAVAPR